MAARHQSKDTALAYQGEGQTFLKTAIAKDHAGEYAEAVQSYQAAINKFKLALTSAGAPQIVESLRLQINQCQRRVAELQVAIQNSPVKEQPPSPTAKSLMDEGKKLHIAAQAKISASDFVNAKQLLMNAREKLNLACLSFEKGLTEDERRDTHIEMMTVEKKLVQLRQF